MNSAGIYSHTQIEDYIQEAWNRLMAINSRGTFLSSRALMNMMKTHEFGGIINLESLAGKVGGLVDSVSLPPRIGVLRLINSLARAIAR